MCNDACSGTGCTPPRYDATRRPVWHWTHYVLKRDYKSHKEFASVLNSYCKDRQWEVLETVRDDEGSVLEVLLRRIIFYEYLEEEEEAA